MEKLPLPVSCLTLSHIIDDVDAVEGYLAEDASAASCLPVLIRDHFFMNERVEKYGLPLNNTIPDAASTLAYLTALWKHVGDYAAQIIDAARNGAAYLIPYFEQLMMERILRTFPDRRDDEYYAFLRSYHDYLSRAYLAAAENGHNLAIDVLERLPKANSTIGFIVYPVLVAPQAAARGGHIATVLRFPTTFAPSVTDEVLEIAAERGDFDMIKAMLAKAPVAVPERSIINAIKASRRNRRYDIAAYLAQYH
jgi:hypothetical protein